MSLAVDEPLQPVSALHDPSDVSLASDVDAPAVAIDALAEKEESTAEPSAPALENGAVHVVAEDPKVDDVAEPDATADGVIEDNGADEPLVAAAPEPEVRPFCITRLGMDSDVLVPTTTIGGERGRRRRRRGGGGGGA